MSLKLFIAFAWLMAITLPLYSLVLYPFVHMLCSGIAGARNAHLAWNELILISLPLTLAAAGFLATAVGLKRRVRWSPRVLLGSLAWLMLLDMLMFFFYSDINPVFRFDYKPTGGLHRSS